MTPVLVKMGVCAAGQTAGCGHRRGGAGGDHRRRAPPLVRMAGSVCVYGVIDTHSVLLEKIRGPYNFNLLIHQWPTRSREAAAQEPLCAWIAEGS